MADPNHPHPQPGQTFPHQFRPPFPNSGVPNQPAGQGGSLPGSGPPKMAGVQPPHVQGQPFLGGTPNSFMQPMGPPGSQLSSQTFSNRPTGPSLAGGGVNGFMPPASQGFPSQGLPSMNRPPGPPAPVPGGAPFQPAGNFRPPVSGQYVPPGSLQGPAPPSGGGPVVNGTSSTPPLQSGPRPENQPPVRFQPPPPGPRGGIPPGGPQPPFSSSLPPAPTSMAGPPRISAPPSAVVPPTPASSASGTSTPNSAFTSAPSELPIPFHGQAQYSHQIGASMQLTPIPTPNNSEPPSQRSSRGPSPVNEQSYDALEGQFSPGEGPPSSAPGQGQTGGLPVAAPPGTQSQFAPPLGPGMAPRSLQGMAPPPRPGAPGPLGSVMAPPPPTSMPTSQGLNQQPRPSYPQMQPQYPGAVPPTSTPYSQPGPPPARPPGPSIGPPGPVGPATRPLRPPGPPMGPLGHFTGPTGPPAGPPAGPPGPLTGPPAGPPGPPTGPPGPPTGLPGPPTGLSGPPTGPSGPPTGPAGPPSSMPGPPPGPTAGSMPGPPAGPFNLGPPTSMQGSSSAVGYYQPPPRSQSNSGPPSGPYTPPQGTQGYPQPQGTQGYSQPQGTQGYSQPQGTQGYPQPGAGQNAVNSMAGDFSKMNVSDSVRAINLMQEKRLIGPEGVETARPHLFNDQKRVNCSPEVFRCTLNAIPQTSALLNKARLPLGILIHPFKDLSQLPVIQSSVIVRCRSCRTYINPFVTFIDQRRWKCNLCFRINELPEEFSFDPVSKTYGDPQRRPEIKSATIEFIAPSEYMLRPPQPAVYLFVLDVSFNAVETGYLRLFTQTLVEELERLPGDARTQVGFLCFDRSLYFFNLSEGLSQPQMMVVPDLEDVFLPTPDNLLVNLHECRDLVVDLLTQLPSLFEGNHETGNALGTALQAAFKLMSSTGGRVTVMQTMLPTVGPGALENRETSSKASSLNSSNMGPASDFYKKLALDCSAQQVAVDLFLLNGQFADIASVCCISKYSAGCVQYYPSFHTVRNPGMSDKFESDLRRYLTRKIGFESVMRIRCTRGVSIHTFHGNFFVRSTDLLSLPNVNPDAGFGMQMSIEDNLTDSNNVCFQAALLYTSSKGERRIRVHTLCVPITNQLTDVFAGADQQAIVSLLAKMAVDRTITSSLEDARDAMMNACQDMMNAYAAQVPASQRVGALVVPSCLRLIPLLTLAMLKSIAFRLSASIKIDNRVFFHLLAKTTPTSHLLQMFYPHLYPVHNLNDEEVIERGKEKIPKAPRLQLSSANIDRHGVYILDQGDSMYMMVCGSVSDAFCKDVLDVPNFMSIPEGMVDLPELDNPTSERLRCFISYLMDSRPGGVFFLVLREDSKQRQRFFHYMVEDRTEGSMSYYEFLQYIQQKVKA